MKHTFNRRHMLGATAGILGGAALPTWAQTPRYPSRTITLVVPFAAGGSVDVSEAESFLSVAEQRIKRRPI